MIKAKIDDKNCKILVLPRLIKSPYKIFQLNPYETNCKWQTTLEVDCITY